MLPVVRFSPFARVHLSRMLLTCTSSISDGATLSTSRIVPAAPTPSPQAAATTTARSASSATYPASSSAPISQTAPISAAFTIVRDKDDEALAYRHARLNQLVTGRESPLQEFFPRHPASGHAKWKHGRQHISAFIAVSYIACEPEIAHVSRQQGEFFLESWDFLVESAVLVGYKKWLG